MSPPWDRLKLLLALSFVRLVGFVVPRRQRDTWLAEWRGELCFLSSAPSGPPTPAPRGVLAHSLNAIPHATAHRRHDWSPEMLLQDLRYAVRRLIKSPAFTSVAMLTIAIGVGANTAIFSVIDSTLLNPLPYPDADRLVFLWKQAPGMNLQTTPRSEDIERWRERATSFEDIQVYSSATLTMTGGDEPSRVIGLRVLPGFFGFLGARPVLGREFSEDEARLEERVVVLSHGLWQAHYGGADDVLGRTLSLDQESYTVIGVMPSGFHFQAPFEDTRLWLPLSMENAEQHASPFAMARLAAGISHEVADEELAAIAAAASEEAGEEVWPGVARRPQDLHGSRFGTSLLVLQAAVAIVLLIACANVANLLLARGAGQGAEMALRAAIGASRGRLLRQLLTEHLLLALGGGLLGYALARAAVAAIILLRPERMTALATARIDGWIFFVAMGIAALTGVLFGLGPALQASRPGLSAGLGRSSGTGRRGLFGRSFARDSLVVAEVAMALLLLVGAGLLFGSLFNLINVDLGFRSENVLSMSISLPDDTYPDEAPRRQFYDELTSRIRQVAGSRLEGIAAATGPLPTLGLWFGDFAADGDEAREPFLDVAAHSGRISPGFFDTLGVALVDGRAFVPEDVGDADNPVIINATWAQRMWGEERAVGRRVRVDGRDEPTYFRVIGVIEDAMLVGPTGGLGDFQIFQPTTAFSYVSLIIRTREDPLPLVPALKDQVWAIDPDLPIENIATLEQVYGAQLASQRFNVILLGAFAGTAVLLALIGVYGVLSYAVGQRTREIGIRKALGARKGDVVPMIAWQGMRMVLVGVVFGIGGAMALTRFIESLLYEVQAIDPATYLVVSVGLIVVASLACLIPALRAARLESMEALRQG